MKVNVHIHPNEDDERIDIYTSEMTEQLNEIIQLVERSVQPGTLYGKKGEDIFPLPKNDIVRFYTENKTVYGEIGQERFRIDKRIYELEEMLPHQFIRISQSEIIHLAYLKKLKLELNGLIQIVLKNGVTTYSSRRYVKKMKEALQL